MHMLHMYICISIIMAATNFMNRQPLSSIVTKVGLSIPIFYPFVNRKTAVKM